MKQKLKPCPFCGGEAYIATAAYGTQFVSAYHTKKCVVQPDTYLISEKFQIDTQIEAWNRRVNDE